MGRLRGRRRDCEPGGVSGLLLEWFWWGSVFCVNLPIIAVASSVIWLLPHSRAADGRRLDLVGGDLSVVGPVALVFAVIEGPARGWSDHTALLALVTGVVVLAGFLYWESRTDHHCLSPTRSAPSTARPQALPCPSEGICPPRRLGRHRGRRLCGHRGRTALHARTRR